MNDLELWWAELLTDDDFGLTISVYLAAMESKDTGRTVTVRWVGRPSDGFPS